MRIENSSLSFSSSHELTKATSSHVDFKVWNNIGSVGVRGDSVSLSMNDKTSATMKTSEKEKDAVKDAIPDKYLILLRLLEKMAEEEAKALAEKNGNSTGGRMDVIVKSSIEMIREFFSAVFNLTIAAGQSGQLNIPQSAGQSQQSVGWGIQFTSINTYVEAERTTFNAQGTVQAGGKEFNIDVSLLMERSYIDVSTMEFRAGDALNPVDPLVINLDAGPAMLSGQKIRFDINADGADEEIAALVNTSGFLVFDKNGNGMIDDGLELFGPATGNGFSELAAHDEDNNGWIDESDSIYSKLGVWIQQSGGTRTYLSLKELDIGAIYTGNASTEFSLTDMENNKEAAVRQTGIYLRENGTAGTIQNLDFFV